MSDNIGRCSFRTRSNIAQKANGVMGCCNWTFCACSAYLCNRALEPQFGYALSSQDPSVSNLAG
eukprot:90595-Pleurochrysis_carterae.AAC.1